MRTTTQTTGKLRKKLSYEKRRSLFGYGFIAMWFVGFIVFFLRPLIMIMVYTVASPELGAEGYVLSFVGLENYRRLFLEDPEFLQRLFNSFLDLVMNVPIIVAVSLLVAVILNQKFVGRTFFRGVFFVPVIVATGLVIGILKGETMSSYMMEGGSSAMMSVSSIDVVLERMNVPTALSTWLIDAANSIFDLLWKSGIQILLFIAALQTIPASVYEASSVEGASGWINFWKITIPMISPMILLSVVYTIIDSFVDSNNKLMSYIDELSRNLQTSYSSTMAVIYFVCVLVFIGAVYKLMSRFVFYSVD